MNWHSQAGQDRFAWEMSGKKLSGTFIDIGCNEPFFHNNTAALEEIGWTGICVDISPFDYSSRKSDFIQADATHEIPGLNFFIKTHSGQIDYLSMDADDATLMALAAMVKLCNFKVITVEHDRYRIGSENQERALALLTDLGYVRVVKDVLAPESPGMPWSGQPFEDWYFRP